VNTEQPKQEQSATRSEALERLRDRTDELELIISSLTIFALFSLPGWLFSSYAGVYTHLSTALAIAGTTSIVMLTGVCYGLAACFVVHLMARAYWVGLIGLRTVFPEGINWSKTPGIGPLTKQRYRESLPDLDTAIRRTDRLASSLFAVISLLTLTLLWFSTVMVLTMVVAGHVGSRFGLTNAGLTVGALSLAVVFVGLPALLWFMDALLAARIPRLQESRFFLGIVRVLGWMTGIVYPRRLIMPVQLTLQSNTRPVIFYIALMAAIAAIFVVGNTRIIGWSNFTLSGEFTYLTTSDAAEGFRSTYYEDMASPKDRLRAFPRVDSFTQTGSFVRLFLPYQPLRDNLILDQLCGSTDDAEDRVECLRKLWSVSIEDQPVPMAGFAVAERLDIGMRGLIGLVPMSGLKPGLRSIRVEWNPDSTDQDALVDDRYTQINRIYEIPIAFAPDYELQLD
jgi:hypothetical protein